MYRGNVRRDLAVAGECLRLIDIENPSVLEIGCGNGYYFEVFAHLYKRPYRYVGLDYSQPMISSAHEIYRENSFVVGDALQTPSADASFDIAWSGTVLMHLPDYKKAISETCRVARHFCVFHSVPVRLSGPTTFLTKKAYGVPVAEVLVNRTEFEDILHGHGLVIRHILGSLPYQIEGIADVNDVETLSYVCEKRKANDSES